MNYRFARVVIILVAVAVGYSILSSPGNRFSIDVQELKTHLLYILLGAGAYAIYVTVRIRRPPGL